MKDPAKQWLPERVTVSGILASALRRPNGKCACQCSDASCPPDKMEKLLRQLEAAQKMFAAEKSAPRWVTWVFESVQIRFVARPDGWMFAVAVRPETEAMQSLNALSAEFLSLKFGR